MYSIYKIHYKDFCYVGITTNFQKRLITHKSRYNSNSSIKVYQVIRDNNGWDNWKKEIIELTDDNTREGYWIGKIGNINSVIPSQTGIDRTKIYRDRHREKTNEKKRSIIVCECGATYTYGYGKARHEKTISHLSILGL